MKKLIPAFCLVALMVSCQQEKEPAVNYRFVIEESLLDQDTKTGFEKEEKVYYPFWNKGDQISCFTGEPGSLAYAGDATNTNEYGKKAKFLGSVSSSSFGGDSGVVYAVSPSSACQSNGVVKLKSAQSPSKHTYDPSCDILVSEEGEYAVNKGDVSVDRLYFSRQTALVKINVLYPNLKLEKIQMLKLTAPSGTVLAGDAVCDFENGILVDWSKTSNIITASFSDGPAIGKDGEAVYLMVNPCQIESGSTLGFEVETQNLVLKREIVISKNISFIKGNITVLNVNFDQSHIKDNDIFIKASFVSDPSNVLNICTATNLSKKKGTGNTCSTIIDDSTGKYCLSFPSAGAQNTVYYSSVSQATAEKMQSDGFTIDVVVSANFDHTSSTSETLITSYKDFSAGVNGNRRVSLGTYTDKICLYCDGTRINASTSFEKGKKYHLTATWDPGTNNAQLYVDGLPAASAVLPNTAQVVPYSTNTSGGIGNSWILGGYLNIQYNTPNMGWGGNIYSADIYTRVLSPEEIASLPSRKHEGEIFGSCIWKNSKYNSFVDLIRYQNKYVVAFRESNSHAPESISDLNGVIRFMISDDARTWTDCGVVLKSDDYDLRDPHMCISPKDGSLLCYYAYHQLNNSWVSPSKTGVSVLAVNGNSVLEKSSHQIAAGEVSRYWIWGIQPHGNYIYGIGYYTTDTYPVLVKSSDGVNFDVVSQIPYSGNEAGLCFDGERIYAVLRNIVNTSNAGLAYSDYPYSEWHTYTLNYGIHSPAVLVKDGKMYISGRKYESGTRKGVGLFSYNLARNLDGTPMDGGNLTSVYDLPCGSPARDNAYPGMIYFNGSLHIVYYAIENFNLDTNPGIYYFEYPLY